MEYVWSIFGTLTVNYWWIIRITQILNCLEGNTISNPVHTSETRMCGGKNTIDLLLPGGQYIAKGHA